MIYEKTTQKRIPNFFGYPSLYARMRLIDIKIVFYPKVGRN